MVALSGNPISRRIHLADGSVYSIYVIFQSGRRSSETLQVMPNVCIDVDEHDYPVAVEVEFPRVLAPESVDQVKIDEAQLIKVMKELAQALVVWYRGSGMSRVPQLMHRAQELAFAG